MSAIAQIRSFNRFYTSLIGVLDEHIVRSPYTLAEARVLYEIATRGNASAVGIARALDLDKAYLSRILQKLIGENLVLISPHPLDRRSNRLMLSADGDAAFAALDAGSESSIEALVAPLSPSDCDALLRAMRAIRTLLGDGGQKGPVVLRPPRLGELGWLIHRQALLYNEQFGWNVEFEGLIARIYAEYQSAPGHPPKYLWVAAQDDTIVGSIFVLPSDGIPGSAQLRMLYVEPAARGQGIGATLVRQSVDFACAGGYGRMRLWTHANQESARRLYAAAGFVLVETIPERNFGKELTGEIWEMVF